jgi:signal transduction histidine kinase/CheY-like chemotaxis protein
LRHRDPAAEHAASLLLGEKPVPIGAGFAGAVAQTGESLVMKVERLEDLLGKVSEEYRELLKRYPLFALLVVPMRLHGKILGVVSTGRAARDRPFSDQDRLLMQDLADRAALAVGHARIFEAEYAARQRLLRIQQVIEALSKAVTIQDVARVAMSEGCAVTQAVTALLYAKGSDQYLRLVAQNGVPESFLADLREIPPDSPLPGAHVMRTQEPVWIENFEQYEQRFPDLASRAKSANRAPAFAAVPLVTDGECLGVLAFGFREDHPFPETDRAFILMLAHHCAQALFRARLFKCAEEAAHEAEEANRLKDEFLATISHELRTPLSAILGWTAIIKRRGRPDDKTVDKGADVIERSGRSQLRIIDDILDVSRIIRGQLRIDEAAVDLEPIARDVLESLGPAASAKGIDLIFDGGEAACRLIGDAERLRQVLWNLLSNAVKFTPEGGTVTLRMRYAEGKIDISVSDTGRGIEPRFLPHVFDRFRQEDGRLARTYGGLGLGLAIVRHLVEMHGGTVRAESDGIGKGATFTVTLPIRPFTSSTQAHAPMDPTAGSGGPEGNLRDVNVLVVEDDDDSRELIKMLLVGAGAAVEVASGPEEALRKIAGRPPHVVVTDLAMPERDGYWLLERLKQLDPGMPVIALTAFGSYRDAARTRDAGFDEHLSKPVDPSRLIDVIARARQKVLS